MPSRTINLTEHFDRFVEEQVATGNYKNASEVLRAGLRLLQQQTESDEQKLMLLRRLATDGFRSLDRERGLTIKSEEGLRKTISRLGKRMAKSRTSGNQK